MNNEMRDKVIKIVTDVYDRQAQICDSADEIIDLVEAALTQQQEAEPVAWLCASKDGQVDAATTTHQRDTYARVGREILPVYLHPPKPAAAPSERPFEQEVGEMGAGDVLALVDDLPETPQEAYALGYNRGRIAPKPAAQPLVPEGMLRVELAMSDRSISRLIHVAQIETSNTNEVERYANQCWRELSAAKEEG